MQTGRGQEVRIAGLGPLLLPVGSGTCRPTCPVSLSQMQPRPRNQPLPWPRPLPQPTSPSEGPGAEPLPGAAAVCTQHSVQGQDVHRAARARVRGGCEPQETTTHGSLDQTQVTSLSPKTSVGKCSPGWLGGS